MDKQVHRPGLNFVYLPVAGEDVLVVPASFQHMALCEENKENEVLELLP